jgi:predicted dehydrogenase
MVRVGLVGIGFMGWIHYLAYQRSQAARLVGFTSRDPKKLSGDWTGIQGNFGPPGEQIDMDGLRTWDSLEKMVCDPDIDVIDICLPPFMHLEATLLALENGKHVFCEKPFALKGSDCQKMLDAAKAADRQVMVAHVLPFMGPFAYATQLVQNQTYGRPIGGYFKRVISNPTWIPDFYDPLRVGGPMIDLHVHDTHWIEMLFGSPTEVTAVGTRSGAVAKYAQVVYRFDDPEIAVSSTSGVVEAPGRPFTHGFELHLEKAMLQFEFAAYTDGSETIPLRVLTHDGQVIHPDLGASDDIAAFAAEIDEMAECIRDNRASKILDGRLAAKAISIAEAIQRSVLSRQPSMIGVV